MDDPRRGAGDPAELRPLVPLDGGRFATSDLNDLSPGDWQTIGKRLIELRAPDIVVTAKSACAESSTLFDNGRRGRVITGANSATEIAVRHAERQTGRFRQNLLGKRVIPVVR